MFTLLLLAGLASLIASCTAGAAAPLNSSPPLFIDSHRDLSDIACPASSLCVAVDRSGAVLSSTTPLSASGQWTPATVDSHPLTAVSCPTASLCVAVDEAGGELSSINPAGGSWSAATVIDPAGALTAVSCPTASLCVAVDQTGQALTSGAPASGAWAARLIDQGSQLTAVSCASPSLCVAVDNHGRALTSANPAEANPLWRAQAIDPTAALLAVSCSSGGVCVALDSEGKALVSADPAAETPTWSQTEIDRDATDIWCASSGLCASVDSRGQALLSDNASSPLPQWTANTLESGGALVGVACLAEGACLMLDAAGQVIRGLLPAPLLSASAAREILASEATVSATVDPNDTTLAECRFEYGSDGGYQLSVPCESTPAATATAQTVSARLTGLTAATSYSYRLRATNLAGASVSEPASFTTASRAPLLHPSPTIAGLPIVGGKLRCLSGLAASAGASVSYLWLADAATITGAQGSVYQVKAADARHHLRCRVSVHNSAGTVTVDSPFVAIPAQGAPPGVAETAVGPITVRGAKVTVALRCSPRAPAGCTISLRLTARGSKHRRSRTVTLAARTVYLREGQRLSIVLAANAAGRRMLAHKHRLTARLSVSGTVIGALRAPLAATTLTLR